MSTGVLLSRTPIWCDLCGRMAERVEVFLHPERRAISVSVSCHGGFALRSFDGSWSAAKVGEIQEELYGWRPWAQEAMERDGVLEGIEAALRWGVGAAWP